MKYFLSIVIFSIMGLSPFSTARADVTAKQAERLKLQHHLDYRAPLYDATFIGTHNSYNSTEDGYNLADPTLANHVAGIEKQLNAGARALSFDLVDPVFDLDNDIFQCHGACGIGDKELSYGVGKVKDWLAVPANSDEVIIIVIEESSGFDSDADRTSAASYFNVTGFGDKVYRPQDYSGADTGIRELPLQDLTKQKIRDAGKNILLVCDDCNGPNSWDNMVWDLPFTLNVRRSQYDWSVVPEDRTSLPSNDPVSGATFRSKLEQGAGILGLDYMVATNRHNSLIWSWKQNEPNNTGGNEHCAAQISTGEWNDANCAGTYKYACQNVQTGGWLVPATTGNWSNGSSVCASVPGGLYIFSVPINANNNVSLKTAAAGATVWLNYNDVASEGDWQVIDFVDVRTLPVQSTHQTSGGIFNHFKIPADTPYDRVEFRVKGGNGGFAQVYVDYCCGGEDKDIRQNGGSGAHVVAAYNIGTGASDIPPGSGIGIVAAQAGDDHYESSTCDPFCPGRHATGGGGGGSSVIIYKPVPVPGPVSPSSVPWEPYVVAGGGGGAFRELDVGAHGDSSSSFTTKGNSAGGSAGPVNCSGGGGGAFHEGTGTFIVDRAGEAGDRTWGGGATPASDGGNGYGGGGSTGSGALSGGGGGGGYKGGDGGKCSLAPSGRVGSGGYSYVHTNDVGSYTTTVFDVPAPHANSDSFDSGVVVVTFSITNRPPEADADAYNATEDTVLNVAASGVLIGDTDADSDPLTAVKDTDPGNGSVTLNTNGSFSYTPNSNYCGQDSFTYHANDGTADSNIATVTITVACVDDPPVAVDDTLTVTEDDSLTTKDVLFNDTDIDGGPKSIASFTQPANGLVQANGADLDYRPNANYCNNGNAGVSTDDFTYTLTPGGSTATVAVTVTCVNDAPVANDDAYDATEDTLLSIDAATGVLFNDTDVDGDALSVLAGSVNGPSHGTLNVVSDGSFTYQGNLNYCGPDSFSYKATDAPPIDGTALDSGDPAATVSITVACVNDPPTVTSVVPGAQTSDYSDDIGTVIIEVNDVDNVSTTLAESNEPPLSAAGLSLTSTGCTLVPTESPAENGSDCTWDYDGQVLDPGDNVHVILFTASDGDGAGLITGTHTLTIVPEEATVVLDSDNDVALQVAEDGGDSGPFSLFFTAVETIPDLAHIGSPEFGNLNKMVPYMELVPVGPGGPISGVCSFITATNPGDGYAQVAGFECTFDEVPVNTYEVAALVDGSLWPASPESPDMTRYYTGADDAVLVIYDPSLGFTTGGGWFYWPGTADPELLACGEDGYAGDKTNFGFNMKYNKKHTNVQGNLLMMRHTVDANCEAAGKYRVKSNALNGLSIGDDNDGVSDYGWAAFSGKSVFSEPLLDGSGNNPFLVYVEDHGDEGGNQDPADDFWIQVKDKDGNVLLETGGPVPVEDDGTDGDDVSIENGNIIVPHSNKGGGKK